MDPIANLLTSLQNSYSQQKEQMVVPASNLSAKLCQLLKTHGYISGFKTAKERNLEIDLKYQSGIPAIHFVKRISKPSHRRYCKAKNIPRPTHGHGVVIVSTSQGLMTHLEAKKKNLGGEIICEVA
jgi:small subunit ribosomal protein S8